MIKTKLKNKIIITLILILLFIMLAVNNSKVDAVAAGTNPLFIRGGSTDTYMTIEQLKGAGSQTITMGVLSMNDSVFCVQHGQKLKHETEEYEIKYKYEITPNKVTRTNIKTNEQTVWEGTSKRRILNYAQGIAYILNLDDNAWGDNKGLMTGDNEGAAQHILWAYLWETADTYKDYEKLGMSKGLPQTDLVPGIYVEDRDAIWDRGNAYEKFHYNVAMDVRDDNYSYDDDVNELSSKSYYATYYTFEASDETSASQKLIIVESTDGPDVPDVPEIPDDKNIKITINKKDYDTAANLNATFTATFKQGSNTITTKTLNTTGGNASTTVEIADTSKDVVVTISETVVPDGYIGLSGNITLTFKYEDHKWKKVSQTISDTDKDYVSVSGSNDITLDIKNEKIKTFSITLNKFSSIGGSNTVMDGTKFNFDFTYIQSFKVNAKYLNVDGIVGASLNGICTVEIDNGKWIVKNSSGNKIGETKNKILKVADGDIKITDIKPKALVWKDETLWEKKTVYIRVSENTAINGYKKLNYQILFKAKLDDPNDIKVEYFISKDPDSSTEENKIQNIINKFLTDGNTVFDDLWTTDLNSAGYEMKSEVNRIVVLDGKNIVLDITNKKLITIKGKVWNDGQTGLKSSTAPNGKIDTNESGMAGIKVYLCRQKGDWIDDMLEGFTDGEEVIPDAIIAETTTSDGEDGLSVGEYKFENIESASNLYVVFGYDGMNYIETVGSGNGATRGYDSDATENAVNIKRGSSWWTWSDEKNRYVWNPVSSMKIKSKSRDDFNKQFELIKNDGAYQYKDISSLSEKFDQIKNLGSSDLTLANITSILGEESKAEYIWNNIIMGDGSWESKLEAIKQVIYDDSFYTKTTDLEYYKADEDGKIISRLNTSSSKFNIYATCNCNESYVEKNASGEYIINCGLVKREFDLDLSTNLETVKTEINGKTTNYKYSIDDTGNATLYVRDEGDEGKLSKKTYNQAIYESDYNYNIDDYFDNTASFALDDATGEKQQFKNDANEIHNDGTDELDIYVTYRIQINNQNNKTAYVYEIEDYYSDVFEYIVSCKDENENDIAWADSGSKKIGENTYKKIQIQLSNSAFEKDGANYLPKVIYLVFKLDKTKLSASDLEIGNIAEITSYGSDEGLIDMNSRPGNAFEGSSVRYEDDTDKAGVLNVKIDSSKKRTLSGIVWDDEDKKGKYDTGEKLVNGVTVQLIELRKVNGITLEYIWQEMITGEDKVSKIDLDGSSVKEYTYTGDVNKKGLDEYIYIEGYNKTKEEFHYLFTGYIPGNYIVRYKYGLDGGTYNGNDYKSTYDRTGAGGNAGTRYKGTSQLNLTENERFSDAFDNEARRLEEMAIFAGETVTSTTSLDLAKHWMCADTNKFELCFEDPDYTVEDGEQTVKAVDNNASQKDIGNCTVEKIDFGLMKRPKTEVSLEKHLTALAIDVAGEGKILDAKFNIEKFYTEKDGDWNKYEECIEGIKANLVTIRSTRDERGFWKFETDVNELMNGAELTAEYTYVVSNNSEGDYLSAQLMNAYEQLNKGEPCQFIYEGETSETTLVPGVVTFKTLLNDIANKTKLLLRKTNADGTAIHENGYYLGDHYYTGVANSENVVDLKGGTSESILEGHGALSNWWNKLAGVTIRIDKIEELVNKEFYFDENINYSSYGPYNNFTADSTKVTPAHLIYYEYKENETGKSEINTTNYSLVQSKGCKTSLRPGDKNYDKKIVLTKTLNTNNINDISFDSYNAEILSYSVASGRGSETTKPGNLEYSYSANKDDTLVSLGNESDEFWGETIIITAPTGNNTALWIILGVTCAIIIVGGVFGIKKFVLKH